MFDSIRKHQSWLWILIGTVVIVSFIWYFLPETTQGGRGGKVDLGTINGRAIRQRDFQQAEAQIQFEMALQGSRERTVNKQQVFQQLFMQGKIEEFGIKPGAKAMSQFARDYLESTRQQGITNYSDLVDKFLPMIGYNVQDFNQFARRQAGMQQLETLVSAGGGLVPPQDAEARFRAENEELTALVALFSSSNFLSQVEVKPEDLQTYFTNNQANYRTPEKMKINMAVYSASNFLAEADKKIADDTTFNQRLDRIYKDRGPETFKDAEGKQLTPEAAKEKIKNEGRIQIALESARPKAITLATDLIEPETKTLGDFPTKAAKYEMPVQTTEPFERATGPSEVPEDDRKMLAGEAFKLTNEEPFIGPLRGKEAFYVIGLNQKIPSAVQPFDQVKEKVTEDFKKERALELARKAGKDFHAAATNGLAQSKSIETIATESNVKLIATGAFAKADRNLATFPKELSLPGVARAAGNVLAGKAGEFTTTGDGGLVVFVLSRSPVKEDKFKTDFPKYLQTSREQGERLAFNEWINNEYRNWMSQQPDSVKKMLMGDRD